MASESKEDFTVAKPETLARDEYSGGNAAPQAGDDQFETFKKDIEGGEAYRTNGKWPRMQACFTYTNIHL
jgi:hypothetical protein